MFSRRRFTRFALTSPWLGTFRTLQEVLVQRGAHEGELVAISEKPGLVGEISTLDVLPNGSAIGFTVRMVEGQPVIYEGTIRHSLRLAVLTGARGTGRSQLQALATAFNGSDLFGVLGRQVSVRLLNISGAGCLLESRCRLELGTTGSVRLTHNREQYRDDIRVTRCQALEGAGSTYLVGAEFLWTRCPYKQSLRRVIRRLQRDLSPVSAREKAS